MFMQRWLAHRSAVAISTKRLLLAVSIVTFIIGSAGAVIAGNTASATVEFSVEEIAVMNVMGTLSGPLTLTAPEHGTDDPINDRNTYIRYTSVVPDGKTRTLTAAITSGVLPSGCALKLEVADLSGNGNPGLAVPGDVYLSGTPQDVVAGIGNCYTGTGSSDGVQLAFTLVVEDEASLVVGETTTVMISFTLK